MEKKPFVVQPGTKVSLKDYDPGYTGKFKDKQDAQQALIEDIQNLATQQDVLYAMNTYSVLLIFQAMDAAGKDGVIKHVMSGVNPQGCQVFSFKAPSQEELDHGFLWRCMKVVPERGRIGIFNRSYYEEVLIVRVHPEILQRQQLPPSVSLKTIWQDRYEDINNFERYLVRNGTVILKFFLHLSREEQKSRFLKRIDQPERNWKFSATDIKERALWDDYMKAYEEMCTHTSTEWAPWYIIPADHKWFTRATVADIIVKKLGSLNLHYPLPEPGHAEELLIARQSLATEKG